MTDKKQYVGTIESKEWKEGKKKDKTDWRRVSFKVVGEEGTKTLAMFEDEEKNADMIKNAKVGDIKLFEYSEKDNPQGGPSYKTIYDDGIKETSEEGPKVEKEIPAPDSKADKEYNVESPGGQKTDQAKLSNSSKSEYEKYWATKRELEKQGASERLLISCLIQTSQGKDLTKEEDLIDVQSATQKLFIAMRTVKINLQENNDW